MNLSIVIPVYNEGTSIKSVIRGIEEAVTIPHEVLLIYDRDSDTTIQPVKDLQKTPLGSRLKLVKNKYHSGALNAIKTGLETAWGDAIIVTMADSSDDPKTIPLMYKKFTQGYDIVCGSRYTKGGKKIGGPLFKSFLSWFSGITAKYLMNLPTYDLTNSYKLYSRKMLESITIESKGGFELGMEILLKGFFLKGAKVTEVPTTWYDRTEGESRFRLVSWLPRYLHWYIWGIKKKLARLI